MTSFKTWCPRVADLVPNQGYQPPLDVNITDNLGRIVACVEMNSQLKFRPTSDTWKLRADAVLPYLATVVDHKGRIWKKSFGESRSRGRGYDGDVLGGFHSRIERG
jgi:hypothetical protein